VYHYKKRNEGKKSASASLSLTRAMNNLPRRRSPEVYNRRRIKNSILLGKIVINVIIVIIIIITHHPVLKI